MRRASNREQKQHKREKCIAVINIEWSWRFEEYFDVTNGDAEFGVYPAGFWSFFFFFLVQHFLTLPPLYSFGMEMYILCHCMLEDCDLGFDSDFIRDYN